MVQTARRKPLSKVSKVCLFLYMYMSNVDLSLRARPRSQCRGARLANEVGPRFVLPAKSDFCVRNVRVPSWRVSVVVGLESTALPVATRRRMISGLMH